MKWVDHLLWRIYNEYKSLPSVRTKKIFIKKLLGIDIDDYWSNLPGYFNEQGGGEDIDSIYISGSRKGRQVYRLLLNDTEHRIGYSDARFARMFVLI